MSVEHSLSEDMDRIDWYASDTNLTQDYRQKSSLQKCYVTISQTYGIFKSLIYKITILFENGNDRISHTIIGN